MSILGSLGHLIAAPAKGLEHLVTDPGGWAKNIGHQATDPKTLLGLAGTLALPGVGGALTGALGAIPGVGALGAGLSSAAGAVGEAASHIPGATAIEGLLGHGAGVASSAIPDAAMGLPAAAGNSGILGSIEGLAGKAGSFLTGNGGKNALGVASALSSYLNQQKANDYAKNALGNVESSYAERAPLRAQGLATLAQSPLGNPYATGVPNTLPVRG